MESLGSAPRLGDSYFFDTIIKFPSRTFRVPGVVPPPQPEVQYILNSTFTPPITKRLCGREMDIIYEQIAALETEAEPRGPHRVSPFTGLAEVPSHNMRARHSVGKTSHLSHLHF